MRLRFLAGALALMMGGGAMAIHGQAPAQPAQKARAFKSAEEQKAFMGVMQAATPDAQIAAAEDFVAKYPDSDFKALAYLGEAQSYQQKNDYDHLIVFGEQALESNPDPGTHVQTLLLLARAMALKTGEYDLDREEKLAKIEKYANTALDMLKTMPKPNPQLPDAQWDDYKADLMAEGHAALAQDQVVRKDFPKAISEYKTALETAKHPDPATQVRLAQTYEKAEKYDDAVTTCDQVLATPNLHPAIKAAAEAEKARAQKLKGVAAAKP